MSGGIPPFPLYAFMAWCLVKSTGTTLPLPLNPSFEAFTVVMFHVEAFWVVMPCSFFTLKMESSWISETLMLYHNATSRSQHRRPRLET
jgi:hypothetical protein